ncbi:recombination regulator RecX [Legionella waltersii]|uniref:Regulatory protein RecX n=1 Tax=Legionella waltersii TaxID=66969 RepID=A0A0W1AAJ5_9GAMM|nr:recombination regulator RecX [Legionella waltersii]KTD78370.1 recombination regulator RecX [Legionella waltersii]SNV06410.1 regulatory protein RecX [Legionella waltersii]
MTKALDSALRLLARREHSVSELLIKLEQKGHVKDEIQNALDHCRNHGLQSDTRFAEVCCRARVRQGYGPLRIKQELKSKGIDEDVIDSVLQLEEGNWGQYAYEAWQKKYKRFGNQSFEDMQKQQRFLLYRGFDWDIITQMFKDNLTGK